MSLILKKSFADNWDSAKKEWMLVDTEQSVEPHVCACGHFPINELCYVNNPLTQSTLLLGNVCIKKFLDKNTSMIFKTVEKLRENESASLPKKMIEAASTMRLIREKDYSFYSNVRLKRSLSDAQRRWKVNINDRVMKALEQDHVLNEFTNHLG